VPPAPPILPLPATDICSQLSVKIDTLIKSEADFHAKVGNFGKTFMMAVIKYGGPVVAGIIAGKKL
jgi:hypothetical protein